MLGDNDTNISPLLAPIQPPERDLISSRLYFFIPGISFSFTPESVSSWWASARSDLTKTLERSVSLLGSLLDIVSPCQLEPGCQGEIELSVHFLVFIR